MVEFLRLFHTSNFKVFNRAEIESVKVIKNTTQTQSQSLGKSAKPQKCFVQNVPPAHGDENLYRT